MTAIDYSSPITIAVEPAAAAAAKKADSPDFSFADLLDIVNPLQHIPVVSTLYRSITGDGIGTPEKIVGDTLYGGLVGLFASLADTAFKERVAAYDEAVKVWREKKNSLDAGLAQGIEDEIGRLAPYLKLDAAKTAVPTNAYNDMLVLTRVLRRLAGLFGGLSRRLRRFRVARGRQGPARQPSRQTDPVSSHDMFSR